MPTEKFYPSSMPTISGELERKKSNIDSMVYCEKKLEVSSAKKTSLLQNIRGIGPLYTNPVFVLISVCMAIFTCIIAPILTVVVDYGKDKGISESYGIYLINSIGVGDLIGKKI